MLVVALAGCSGGGSGDESPTSAPPTPTGTHLTATPANGNVISNDAFSYSVPEGWEESRESRAVSLAIDVGDEDGFVDNLNVVRDNTIVGLEGKELDDAVERVLAATSATRIRIKPPVELDGEEAVHASAVFELGEPRYGIEQYAVRHDGTGYIVTLSFSPDVTQAERNAVSDSILTTWKWAS
jgi:hypothetical protein